MYLIKIYQVCQGQHEYIKNVSMLKENLYKENQKGITNKSWLTKWLRRYLKKGYTLITPVERSAKTREFDITQPCIVNIGNNKNKKDD